MRLPPSFLDGAFVNNISAWVADYITTHRHLYHPNGVPLPENLRDQLRPFFGDALLDSTHWSVEDPQIKDPVFFRELLKMGLNNLPSFAGMAAVTFGDVVVHRERITADLAFHEMVHAEQYRQLGIVNFAEKYVKGFLAGGEYMKIPLEMQAYALEARFSKSPEQVFLVQEAVSEAIQNGFL